ncbi:MAG: Asp-tRNA(Asn)/Glu-tRNA(Gln) amidotransferase GatCAB subunit C [Candidatus Nealsonbacteria bacterium CG02_land_8_20_14_3_00_37_10]|uniref:Aspartyl/glutamyl-tRNA(Asn/Gln) amidotransferase subunit C n=2 Tax=Candidatus Nealsoniibacteriota TaxID=1817911 RepID=A0A2G9Z117_9BACT|nr:MAG: Asp-tRNA(Asn)/Glu-tRNA(Gln) amidotransferase GatCAB subunit C [Candidatus Nealsonbacteria bacterium CG23_combo_of_CG06-09_8_20_14_all_37_18]PIV44877.1 MAG: Asp-tRNA(Asn)/Glu-tRNA(Gln) amidotransferase GatCAB subunit C [Candidatus Nealsonbacteria bacterium CG02_land_8_20_14_3_00_37_10]
MISKEEVKHIAKLARLGLTEKEIAKYQKELSSILDYIEKLKEVDVSGVGPTSHSVLVENVMRGDESQKPKAKTIYPPTALPPRQAPRQKLLELAPETKDGYLKVKSIL